MLVGFHVDWFAIVVTKPQVSKFTEQTADDTRAIFIAVSDALCAALENETGTKDVRCPP